MSDQPTKELAIMTSQERLDAYNLIIAGCSHVWSKGKLQEDKAQAVLDNLIPLTQKDPYFLAHLTSYAMRNSKAKDLKVFLTYVSGLSSANGMPFSLGSKYNKPNLRYISAAALHMLPPKLAYRVSLLASRKYGVSGILNEAAHFPTSMRESFKNYLKYREAHPEILEGIRKAGLKTTIQKLARKLHYNLNDEAREIIDWPKKGQMFKKRAPLFENLTDLAIAERIREERMPYIGVLAELGKVKKKVSPVVAVAMLEQSTGNQAVIMRATFEDAGILKDPEVLKLYEAKIREAKTTLDRVQNVSKNASDAVKKMMKTVKAESRKETMGDIGKIFVHLDFSGSMENVRDYAAERGAILAEMVKNPKENFAWGWFSTRGVRLDLPTEFEEDAFKAILFGQGDFGGTDCFALYPTAREFGAEVDVFLTDQGHWGGDLEGRIKSYHTKFPHHPMPKACVIVHFNNNWGRESVVKDAYESLGIPVSILKPDMLTESAVVTESVKEALLGPVAKIDEIMATPLLELPNYYYSL